MLDSDRGFDSEDSAVDEDDSDRENGFEPASRMTASVSKQDRGQEQAPAGIKMGLGSSYSSVAQAPSGLGTKAMGVKTVNFEAIASVVPLRISDSERALLNVVEGALDVCEYTDNVDVTNRYGWGGSLNKHGTIKRELEEVFSLLAGLCISAKYKTGVKLVRDRSFIENAAWYAKVFEIGRRYKIMNPTKMRSTYGKMMWMLQDAVTNRKLIGFDIKAEIKTVKTVLEDKLKSMEILRDPAFATAVTDVSAHGRTRDEVQVMLERKREALEYLCSHYACEALDKEGVRLLVNSVADYFNFIQLNREPVDRMIALLEVSKPN